MGHIFEPQNREVRCFTDLVKEVEKMNILTSSISRIILIPNSLIAPVQTWLLFRQSPTGPQDFSYWPHIQLSGRSNLFKKVMLHMVTVHIILIIALVGHHPVTSTGNRVVDCSKAESKS